MSLVMRLATWGGYVVWRALGMPTGLRPGDAVILTYHGVGQSPTGSAGEIMPSQDVLHNHLEEMGRVFHYIHLDHLLAMSREERERSGPFCVVTFDDGRMDTYTQAFPVLKKLGVPATVFLCPSYIGTNRSFWWERITALHAGFKKSTVGDRARADALLSAYFGLVAPKIGGSLASLLETIKILPPPRIEDLATAMEEILPPVRDSHQVLGWEQIREMAVHDVHFGAHTMSHVILPRVDEETASREISESLEAIRSKFGHVCGTFCYPNGNHTAREERLVREAGCVAAVTTRSGVVLSSSANLYALPRLDAGSRTCARALRLAVFISAIKTRFFKGFGND